MRARPRCRRIGACATRGLGEVSLRAPGLAALALLVWIGAAFTAGALLLRRDVH